MNFNPRTRALLAARGIEIRQAHLAADAALFLPLRRITLCTTLGQACRATAIHALLAYIDSAPARQLRFRVKLFDRDAKAVGLFSLAAVCQVSRMLSWRLYSSSHQHRRWFRHHVTQPAARLPQVVTA